MKTTQKVDMANCSDIFVATPSIFHKLTSKYIPYVDKVKLFRNSYRYTIIKFCKKTEQQKL